MKRKMFFAGMIGIMLAFGTGTAFAQGYTGPGLGPVTVAEAKNLRDDSPVVLQGKIEMFLGDEKYLFTDSTGTITVEIDKRLWAGLSINQNDTVEISGEVDKDFRGIEIEVSSIKKI
jgi:uncharacterized protein (TIGR00156 family)